ncbi:glycosyltransferase [Flavobacterium frigoris]|uniref:Glycosyl transferase, group 1 family protein n=1 Tax=Flavobacterium frigoris (strain PS1) TaxID=1086011 RepID=H7FM64_FLAFP|nr:glycosyltransferase [Flavobacterium frigoris]EIA10402.1 glycosyl transferase, group 1 family protein [Flavobacterium frigoris PS1]
MKLLILSSAPLIPSENQWKAYGPYVKEIEIWARHADSIQFCCPIWKTDRGVLVQTIPFETTKVISLISFDIKSVGQGFKALYAVIINSIRIGKAMRQADHIHIRCPGNIGLLGCFVQIFFPNTPKTAKYAGNWDPQSKQPWSYRLQKLILNNTFLTRKMQVLVYGEWPNQSKNIRSFFTATYKEEDKSQFEVKEFNSKLQFIFVGTLVKGKNPLYAIQLVEVLIKKGHQVSLCLYGEGVEKESLQKYVLKNNLESNIILKGNQNQEVLKKAYQESHFVILASISEGWPKAIAEGMFWGCFPLATRVSCVPFMLNYGKRGILLEMDLDKDLKQIELLLQNQSAFTSASKGALTWSRKYTVDVFEQQIKQFLLQE